MNNNPYLPLSLLVALSCWSLWNCYRHGRMLTAASGLHLQILVFFGVGGFAFVLNPDVEAVLTVDAIMRFATICCWPLAIGYGIAIVIESSFFRQGPAREMAMREGYELHTNVLIAIGILGGLGYALDGVLNVPGLKTIPSYFKVLFFPSLFFSVINAFSKKSASKLFAGFLAFISLAVSFYSPWRSVFVLFGATFWLAILLLRPKWITWITILGVLGFIFLLPFQNLKKTNYETFAANPLKIIQQGLALTMAERVQQTEAFVATRLDYVRESAYVERSLESGMALTEGQTYKNIIYQLVPRMFWHDKPGMQDWANRDLPREIGLLQETDMNTSWGVNMFAENMYNFGRWALVWFVPLVFLVARGIESLVPRFYRTRQAVVLANTTFFYFLLAETSVIFIASFVVAIFLVVKVVDRIILYLSPTTGTQPRTAKRRGRIAPAPMNDPAVTGSSSLNS